MKKKHRRAVCKYLTFMEYFNSKEYLDKLREFNRSIIPKIKIVYDTDPD